MSNFTQLNLQGNSNGKPMPNAQKPVPGTGNKPVSGNDPNKKQPNNKQNGSARVATIAGGMAVAAVVVIFVLILHHNSQPPVKTAAASSPITAPVQMSSVSTPSPAPVAKPAKKSARQHKLATFKSKDYGLSFRYPVHYAVKEGEETDPQLTSAPSAAMNFAQPGGVTLSTIELPEKLYAGTDFASGFFTVNVNSKMTADECNQFAFPEKSELDNLSTGPSTVNVAGTDYTEMDDVVSDGSFQANAHYYHLYRNDVCYEFALGLQTAADEANQDLKPVNRDKVFDKLQWMLATVKIKPFTTKAAVSNSASAATSETVPAPTTATTTAATTPAPAVEPSIPNNQ